MDSASKFTFRPHLVAAITALLFAIPVGQARAEEPSFAREVQPLLAKRCYACHGPDIAEGGLSLHEHAGAIAELDSGDFAIVPGQPEQSALIARITSTDPDERMPPEGEPLTAEEINIFKKWIEAGAKWEKHWAFEPLQPQELPGVENSNWVTNGIDTFILAGLESKGLTPAPPADKRTLARRVYYDVTGLPPTPEQLNAFLTDDRPDAYARLVDRLLASPSYGEKWARHWLDVVRYAETNSFERDAAKPFVWKYRDYVIRSLNDDKPYDQFIKEQLAGDELHQVTDDSITATGYYRLGTWDDEPADPLQSKYDDLDNIVSTTGQGFLGLTVGCARCHDHKIDPFPQTNYYGLLAFFADVTPYALPNKRQASVFSLTDLSKPIDMQRRAELAQQIEAINAEKRPIEQAAIKKMDAADQRMTETKERQKVLNKKLDPLLPEDTKPKYYALIAKLKETKQQLEKISNEHLVLSLAKCESHPKQMHVMMRGNPHALGDPVEPCFPDLFDTVVPEIPEVAENARSSGRRRVLAEWIASPENRLTSRVIANRVWQHHFGRGIVRSTNNFGQLGTPPTHPELLDWLALWLTDNDWRLKSLHRLILNSSTYRMSSQANEAALAADPSNEMFWRFNMRRLSAEEIRDSVLMVSGQLNPQMYGPSIYPALSQEVLHTQSQPGLGWGKSSPEEAARRSIYIHIKRSLIPPELSVFDFPDTDTSCEARFITTLPAQALNLLHGQFLQKHAGHLADRVRNQTDDQMPQRVEHTLQLALGRPADEATVADGLNLINRLIDQYQVEREEAFRQFCVTVLNLNEFVYLD